MVSRLSLHSNAAVWKTYPKEASSTLYSGLTVHPYSLPLYPDCMNEIPLSYCSSSQVYHTFPFIAACTSNKMHLPLSSLQCAHPLLYRPQSVYHPPIPTVSPPSDSLHCLSQVPLPFTAACSGFLPPSVSMRRPLFPRFSAF